jgi:GntR family transcriptional regulator, vanillate catabolism transcriptional regulator
MPFQASKALQHEEPAGNDEELVRESSSQTASALLRLTELLLSGEFLPGERMAEVPLALRLNVSRTPLRLALLSLERDGLLEKHPSRGFVVRAFRLEDIYDAIEMRAVMEGTAARFAAERLPLDASARGELLRPVGICVEEIDAAVHDTGLGVPRLYERYIELNERFHNLLLNLAQSVLLRREIERLLSLPFASPNAFLLVQSESEESREILEIGQHQHRALIEAIEQRHGTRAEALAREHAQLTRKNLHIALRSRTLRQMVPGLSLIRGIEQLL